MPWRQVDVMTQRLQFIHDAQRRLVTFTELCALYGVSRFTGYEWLHRAEQSGLDFLQELSRRPHRCPHATDAELTARVSRGAAPSSDLGAPANSSPCWRYCFPLTVQDGFSRYLLACRGLGGTTTAECRPVFVRLFQEHGVPEILRTDNGVPFATGALGRLSQLSVWWVRLGIYPELIEPAHPEQNGRHERMHRTLKRATARPPAPSVGPNSSASTYSARSTMRYGRTKPSRIRPPPRSTPARRGYTRRHCHRSSTQRTSRCGW
jgi:hypothetical protein